MSRSIRDMVPGDYVRDADGAYHTIASIHGIGADGSLAPPSRGGFYVITIDGVKIDMFHAHSYHKRSEVTP